jgi:hypothetical protein
MSSLSARDPGPSLPAGIEKSHNFSRSRINAGQIGALVRVIMVTGQGQIIGVVGSPMLPGYDMLYVQPEKWLIILMDPAIFAALACPAPDLLTQFAIHQLFSDDFKILRAFAWIMAR